MGKCQDRTGYKNEVRAFLNADDRRCAQESRHSDEGLFCTVRFSLMDQLEMFRDEKSVQAGVSQQVRSHQNRDEVPMVEACGPVQTAEGAEYFVGALRATNNTAEMQALIEALFWLNSCVERRCPAIVQQSDGKRRGFVVRQGAHR